LTARAIPASLALIMSYHVFDLRTLRLALSGAILGVAVMGLISQFPYHDAVGAVLGGLSVLVAKARHFI
jgi:hypothetical protein